MTADPSEGASKSSGQSASVRVFGAKSFLVDTIRSLESWEVHNLGGSYLGLFFLYIVQIFHFFTNENFRHLSSHEPLSRSPITLRPQLISSDFSLRHSPLHHSCLGPPLRPSDEAGVQICTLAIASARSSNRVLMRVETFDRATAYHTLLYSSGLGRGHVETQGGMGDGQEI